MYSSGFELMTLGLEADALTYHFAMEDSRFGKSIFPIYRSTTDIYNKFQHGQNWVKAVGTLCLSAYIVKSRGVSWKKNVETVKTS